MSEDGRKLTTNEQKQIELNRAIDTLAIAKKQQSQKIGKYVYDPRLNAYFFKEHKIINKNETEY
ncbi:hypothetical protein ACFOWU_10115 [Epilithonimonas zeae]|uniref:Uncharacterized protein n=1 Tax=Epilithonimonas zeae TaxID=1416779 RepID=A0A1N6GWW5_9FLAO|nr:hypothetical protein [Epilithonimonas zeae]SIO12033.1 hypothetical protein SAMN05444409_2108 [Epilithonimonas zeae]